MDKRSKATSSRSPAPKAFGSFSSLLTRCSSSSSSSFEVPRRFFLPEIGVKKRQFRSPRKDRVEHRGRIHDFSSKNWKIQQTNSTIVKGVNSEVEAISIGSDSIVHDTKAKEDGHGRITELRLVSSSCSAFPTSLQDAYSNIRTDPVADRITQETYETTKASLEDSAAVISTEFVCGHDYNKIVPLNQNQRLKSVLKRKSNGHNHGGGTKSVKQAIFQGPASIKGFHGAKNIENAAGRARKHVTFDIACKDDSNWTPKNHQGSKFTAERNIRRKKMQISSETLAALTQLARLITNVQQRKKEDSEKLQTINNGPSTKFSAQQIASTGEGLLKKLWNKKRNHG